MHKKMRGVVAALAATTLMAMTACSAGGTEPSESEPVDITFTTWVASEDNHNRYIALVDEFREDHPELGEFNIEVIPIAEYPAQLSLRLTSGDAPDLGLMIEAWQAGLLDAGAMHDISALKDDPAWEFDDIIPGLIESLDGENGELYGYPTNNGVHPIIYNKTAFETAGIPTPRELLASGDWTWQTLREVSKQLVDAGVVTYGFDIPQFNFQNYGIFSAYLNAFGADAWPGSDTCGLTDPATVEAYQFVHDLMFEDRTIPSPGNVSSFPTGDTAMYLGPPSTLGDLVDAPFEYDMAPQPEGEGVPYKPIMGQSVMAVWEAGEHKELATELLAYLTSKDAAMTFANVPARSSLRTEEFISNLYPQISPEAAKAAMLDTLDFATPYLYPVRYPEIEVAIKPILDGVWTPDADIEERLAAACEAAEPLLGD